MILKWLNKKEKSKEEWHNWFAWKPVEALDHYSGMKALVWLQIVQRKGQYILTWTGGYWLWEYRFSSFSF